MHKNLNYLNINLSKYWGLCIKIRIYLS
jgi:hypothetical protein